MKYNYYGYVTNTNLFIEKKWQIDSLTETYKKPWFKYKGEITTLPFNFNDKLPKNGSVISDIKGNRIKILKCKIIVNYKDLDNSWISKEISKKVLNKLRKNKLNKLNAIT